MYIYPQIIILCILLHIILNILLCGLFSFFLVDIFLYQDIWLISWDRDILYRLNLSLYYNVVGRILMASKIPTLHFIQGLYNTTPHH